MKSLLAACFILAAPFALAVEIPTLKGSGSPAAPASPSATVVKGEVLEVRDVDSYTYLRLKTADGETWAAVTKTPVKKGAKVTISNAMVMTNFESKSLKKTFPVIVFGSLGGSSANAAGSPAAAAGKDMASAHAGVAKSPVDVADVRVPKASGSNARTVAEILTKPSELKDKPVLLRGKVVKYNPEIMGKNWIHLRDGSGSAGDGTNDILVTSGVQVKVGDVVTVKGTVRTDKDFGAGYAYKVIIEDAVLQP